MNLRHLLESLKQFLASVPGSLIIEITLKLFVKVTVFGRKIITIKLIDKPNIFAIEKELVL